MKRVLVIAAHPDDEVLGAGATIARLAREGAEVHVAIVTEGCSAQYPGRPDLILVKQTQARSALDILGGGELHFGGLPDMKLDTVPLVEVNRFLEEVVTRVDPDIVFTHHAHDLNRDHRVVHEASMIACRPDARRPVRALYAYDVLGVTNFGGVAPSFTPNVFFEAHAFLDHKVRALRAYDVEIRPFPHPRSPEGLEAQGRVYGVLSGTLWAEAFQVIRDTR
jgi:LmbE family N-acetylglucosaminyl deacetylase